jgi:tetratricopeptide (TPR) repeat protein/transcriptional regulator with XRE-family HTH domain
VVFGESVRAYRLRLGITQEELADKTGVSVRTIRGIETGRIARPRPGTVRLLANAFGLSGTDRDAFRQVPRQLPAPPQMFTGRARELAVLDEVADVSTVVISAIDGMAGIGKTALAVHAAHRIADRYPDGQLFTDLHGHTQGLAPVEPGEALDRMLRALGVPGQQIPAGLDERGALYRTRLAGRRVLIVLDNAATENQVVPLLPGTPGCLVLVTSRRRLAGLDHTRTLSLDTLPVPEAVTLLTRAVGEGRLSGQPLTLLVELVQLCGRLPLALRVAAARIRSHPAWTLSHLVQRLRDQQNRLAELEAGERSVIAALDLSYRHLSADQQHTYGLLGLFPGPDVGAYATAALLDSTLTHATRMLDQLLDAHLLQEPAPGRYRFHDLTRAHAAHTAIGDGSESTGHTAVHRLLDYYRHTAALAMDAAYPYERERRSPVPPARTPGPDLSAPEQALRWLDTELPNLLSTAGCAIEHDRPEHVLHLSTIMHRHLRSRARYHDAEALHYQALNTARAIGHRPGELDALNCLGHIRKLHGRYAQAADHYRQALQVARATGHRPGEMDALTGLGHIHRLHGRYAEAADHCQRALRIARAIGHRAGELDALTGLGGVRRAQGRYAEAADHCRQALRIARAIGHRHGELDALNGLGHLHWVRGQHAQAADHYQQALHTARAIGHRHGELTALAGLGDIHRQQGRYAQAAEQFQQLLDIAQESGSRNYEFEARQGLGRLRHADGDPETAIAHHERALALADDLGQPIDQARAHDALAHAHHALDQDEQARRHWQQALDVLTGLGVEHTDEEETSVAAIRTHLARIQPSPLNLEIS